MMGNRTTTPHMNGENGDDSNESQTEPVTDGGAQTAQPQEVTEIGPEERLTNFLRFAVGQDPDKEAIKEARDALGESLQEVAQEKDLSDFECALALYEIILGIEAQYRKDP